MKSTVYLCVLKDKWTEGNMKINTDDIVEDFFFFLCTICVQYFPNNLAKKKLLNELYGVQFSPVSMSSLTNLKIQ